MKITLGIVKVITALLVIAVVIVIGAVLYLRLLPDEELDPVAMEFVTSLAAPPTETNALYLAYGFPASPDMDAFEVGKRIVSEHDRLLSSQKTLQGFNARSPVYFGPDPLVFPADYPLVCNRFSDAPCLQNMVSRQEEIRHQSTKYHVYLERYRKLRELGEFDIPLSHTTPGSPEPDWNGIMRIADLVDGAIAQSLQDPATQAVALHELAAEIRLWRRGLHANDISAYAVSMRMLHQKYSLASEILSAFPGIAEHHAAVFEEISQPLLPSETSVIHALGASHEVFLSEWRDPVLFHDYIMANSSMAEKALISAGVFHPNAILNRYSGLFRKLLDFYRSSPPKVLVAKNADFLREARESATSTHWPHLPVPGGNLLNPLVTFDILPFSLRFYHLIAQSRLLEAQRRLVAGQVPADQVVATLMQWSPQLDDPFSEQPLQWDAAAKRIYFELPPHTVFRNVPLGLSTNATLGYLKQ